MKAEQQLFWWSTRSCGRDFLWGNTAGYSEFFFLGPIGLAQFCGLMQEAKQRKNASK
jgi:hypothetical protein